MTIIILFIHTILTIFLLFLLLKNIGKSMITKKSDGSQVKEKESTDSSTTIEDDEVKGKCSSKVHDKIKKYIKSLIFPINP
jgi:hypothetical protein